jgi:hypothetical protein
MYNGWGDFFAPSPVNHWFLVFADCFAASSGIVFTIIIMIAR